MLRIDHSSNIQVDGLRFDASAFWCIVPVHSQQITVSNVVIYARDGKAGTPNTDGKPSSGILEDLHDTCT